MRWITKITRRGSIHAISKSFWINVDKDALALAMTILWKCNGDKKALDLWDDIIKMSLPLQLWYYKKCNGDKNTDYNYL